MKTLFAFFTILLTFSYSSDPTSLTQICNETDSLKINNISKIEKEQDGKIQDYSFLTVHIGEDYYPNKNNYTLQSATIYETVEKNGIRRRGEYFHDYDSILRATIYNYTTSKDIGLLKDQFLTIETELANVLGESDKSTDSKEVEENWFQTTRTWDTNDKAHVLLALTGSSKKKPNRLRVVIYKD